MGNSTLTKFTPKNALKENISSFNKTQFASGNASQDYNSESIAEEGPKIGGHHRLAKVSKGSSRVVLNQKSIESFHHIPIAE